MPPAASSSWTRDGSVFLLVALKRVWSKVPAQVTCSFTAAAARNTPLSISDPPAVSLVLVNVVSSSARVLGVSACAVAAAVVGSAVTQRELLRRKVKVERVCKSKHRKVVLVVVRKLHKTNQRVVAADVDERHVVNSRPRELAWRALVLPRVGNQTCNEPRHSCSSSACNKSSLQKVVDCLDVGVVELLPDMRADVRQVLNWRVASKTSIERVFNRATNTEAHLVISNNIQRFWWILLHGSYTVLIYFNVATFLIVGCV